MESKKDTSIGDPNNKDNRIRDKIKKQMQKMTIGLDRYKHTH
jgi:hypothetical protein